MDSEQLHHLSLLAQLHEARRDYYKAVEALDVIGHVKISPSVPPDARPDRVQALQQAMVFVRPLRLHGAMNVLLLSTQLLIQDCRAIYITGCGGFRLAIQGMRRYKRG